MSTRQHARPSTSGPVDLTAGPASALAADVEYEDLCECRCTRLPGTHAAGQCLTLPIAS